MHDIIHPKLRYWLDMHSDEIVYWYLVGQDGTPIEPSTRLTDTVRNDPDRIVVVDYESVIMDESAIMLTIVAAPER